MKLGIRNLFKNRRLLSKSPVVFIAVVVSLSILSIVQVNCPQCSSVAANTTENLKILEVKGEIIDSKVEHKWCVHRALNLNCRVNILVLDESSKSLSAPLLIKGAIPKYLLRGEVGKMGGELQLEGAKLIHIEVPGKETKQIQEIVKVLVFLFGYVGDVPVAEEVEFSIITDPDEIRANCNVCGGKGKVPITKWLKAIVQ